MSSSDEVTDEDDTESYDSNNADIKIGPSMTKKDLMRIKNEPSSEEDSDHEKFDNPFLPEKKIPRYKW